MKKYLSLILVCVLICSLFVGCEKNEILTPPDTLPSTNPNEPTINTNASKMELDTYILDYAYAATGKNTMFSPLSLDMALGMVAEGAGSEYQTIFTKLLGRENYSEFAIQYMDYLEKLNEDVDTKWDKYKTVFELANSVWVEDKYIPIENFKNKLEYFSAEINVLDFEDISGTVFKINNWCNEKTHEMIPEIISEEDISEDTTAIIVNTVYFESPWVEEWVASKDNNKFKLSDGSKIDANMMVTSTSLYYENAQATAFGCSYRNGLTFIGILPKETGEFSLSNLDISSLLESETTKYDVDVKMPTFKFENNIENLKNSLTNAGYGILFDKNMGIFTQMLKDKNGNIEITIDNIIQMCAIELDEKGTKAAAATAVITCGITSVSPQRQTKEVILDRPFAFLIYDSQMNQIVFMGKVVNPA